MAVASTGRPPVRGRAGAAIGAPPSAAWGGTGRAPNPPADTERTTVTEDGAEVQRVVEQATNNREVAGQAAETLEHVDRDGGGLDTGPAVSGRGGSLGGTNRDLGAERGHEAVAEQRDAHAGAELDVAVAGLQAEALDSGVERQQAAEDTVGNGHATEQAA